MTRARGFSLWLMPTAELRKKLAQTIHRLARLYGTPIFEPHVTLLGGLAVSEDEALSKTQQLSTRLRPFEVRLSRADYLAEYFLCLFLRVEETEPLLETNFKARQVLDRYSDPRYYPHLSLMYGSLGPGRKQTIVPTVSHHCEARFEVERLHLYSTEGEPGDWYRVSEFPCGKPTN